MATFSRPVIGIVSHPGDGASGRFTKRDRASSIAASYVKFVESGGGRVIPLIYNEPWQTILEKLELVNGVVFTGGGSKKELEYCETVEKIFKKALERNNAENDHFPVYAINFGFELLIGIVSENKNILEKFSSPEGPTKLDFSKSANQLDGSLFQRFPKNLVDKLGREDLVIHTNSHGISPKTLEDNEELNKFFKILTTSKDKKDKVFVSTVRSKKYPVTGFQWNPEKNAFESFLEEIPDTVTEDAILVTQHAANYLVSEARKSKTRPDGRRVRENLIYNYKPEYSGKDVKGYDQVYIFN